MSEQWVSAKLAAARLGMTREEVRAHSAAGRLMHRRTPGGRQVNYRTDSVIALAREHREAVIGPR
jgi:hypothetical protein